ncbi:MAG TPA: hypothetical protein VLZ89_10295 [Anaerolineales bacterium]|nr:hypothetical protein [Anaerolineales bacterium]
MKTEGILQLGAAPLIFMGYGRHLGQLHRSGYDIAGILLFISGAAGLAVALSLHHFTKRYSWHDRWSANTLTGVVSCGISVALVLLLAGLHG